MRRKTDRLRVDCAQLCYAPAAPRPASPRAAAKGRTLVSIGALVVARQLQRLVTARRRVGLQTHLRVVDAVALRAKRGRERRRQ